MRVVLAGTAALLLAGTALAQQQDQPKTVKSTGQAIIEAPLRDLNIIKPKIPPLLEAIMAKPYATDGIKGCPDYAARIRDLTEVLGTDVDSRQAQAQGDKASEFALGATQDIAEGFIPGGGLIPADFGRVKGAEACGSGGLCRIGAAGNS